MERCVCRDTIVSKRPWELWIFELGTGAGLCMSSAIMPLIRVQKRPRRWKSKWRWGVFDANLEGALEFSPLYGKWESAGNFEIPK